MPPLQLGALLSAFLVPWLLWWLGSRFKSPRFITITCWSLAIILLAAELAEFFVKLCIEDTPIITKLPMQLCDWALFLTAAALIWRSSRCFEIAYFWGLAGTFQGLVTPAMGEDLPLWRQVGFFVIHAGIVASILYLIFALGMRPRAETLWRVLLWSEFFFVLAQVVNAFTGQNYGFLAHTPPTHSLLDLFPPNHWLYVATINAVALFAFALLYIPWWIVDRRRSELPQAAREIS